MRQKTWLALLIALLLVFGCQHDSASKTSSSDAASVQRKALSHPEAPPPENLPSTFKEDVPGTSERRCVKVNRLLDETGRGGSIRSGEFVAGPFDRYIRRWVPENKGKLWFAPLHTEEMPGATI